MDLNAIVVFTQIVDGGSFTQAAQALDMTKSTVSRKLAELEKHLGVRLVTRSTRNLVLTEEGEHFYQSCTQILEMLDQAELELTANQDMVRGRLNVVMPVELGHEVLCAHINAFLSEHPNVTVNLEMSNREVDLIAEGIDVYAQVGELSDSSLISRRISSSPRVLVASPGYLRKHGQINAPADLKAPHKMVKLHNPAVKLPPWQLKTANQAPVSIELPYQLRVNTITSCLKGCLNDLGIAVLPEFICREYFASGQLVQLLPEWEMTEVPISLVYANRQLMPKRLSVFIEFLLGRFGQQFRPFPR